MSQALPEEWFVTDSRANAWVTWILTAILVVAAVGYSFAGLLVGAAFAAVAAGVAVVPPLVSRSWTHALPWPLLFVAALPLVLGPLQTGLLGELFLGVGVAALGMLVVNALQLTTTLRMTPGFAAVFVVIATLAVAGFWAVGSAFDAAYLGGTFLETNDALMGVFTDALLAGLAAGLVFWWYFRWQLRRATGPTPEVDSA